MPPRGGGGRAAAPGRGAERDGRDRADAARPAPAVHRRARAHGLAEGLGVQPSRFGGDGLFTNDKYGSCFWLLPCYRLCLSTWEVDGMAELPRSLPEFEARFPDDAACARWLLARRWPDGSRCPACGHDKAWELARERLTLQCAACERQVSVTAGTVLHGSHLGLRTWFLAAWLMATHANGISARQLWRQLGLGSYKSAWLLARKLRRAMVDPEREALAGLVEVDETSVPFRAKGGPVRPGRSHDGKLLLAGAVEIKGKVPGRVRLAVIGDYSAVALGALVAAVIAIGSTVVSDGWSGYARLKEVKHDPRVVGDAPAHLVLPWIHRVFANAKRWALGVYHGLRGKHPQAYLDEFVFRFNRRRTPQAAFARLLGLAVTIGPHPYDALVAMGSKG